MFLTDLAAPARSRSSTPTACRAGRRHWRSPRKGAAAVEFAVVAPVLLLLIFGSIDFGRAMMVSNQLTGVAREGGRVGVLPTSSNLDIETTIASHLAAMELPAGNVQTTILVNGVVANASTANSADLITVSVTVPYAEVSWLPTSWFLEGATLRGRAVMRRE